MDIENYAPKAELYIDENNEVHNVVDLLGGGTPVSDKVYDISSYLPGTGRRIGNDGYLYNIVDLLQNMGSGGGGGSGNNGWTPTLAVVEDGERRVLRIVDWVGGQGTKPTTGRYVASTGLTTSIAAAIDIRGSSGKDGANGQDGAKGDVGADGKDGANGTKGDTGNDGKSAYQLAIENGFVGTEQEWLANLQGADGSDGADGKDGTDGKSSYEIALGNGFIGEEAEWLESLKGAKGIDGTNGTDGINGQDGADGKDGQGVPVGGTVGQILAKRSGNDFDTEWVDQTGGGGGGTSDIAWLPSVTPDGDISFSRSTSTTPPEIVNIKGVSGEDGKSAYELDLEVGFIGTIDEWLASLKGMDGKSAYEIAVEHGFEGTKDEWLENIKGKDGNVGINGEAGKSAYEIAVENGFIGSEVEWLDSLKGDDGTDGINGTDGKSAYELAVNNGFVGAEADWLESIRGQDGIGTDGKDGKDGKTAYEIALDNDFVGTETEWLESLKGADGKDGTEGNYVSTEPVDGESITLDANYFADEIKLSDGDTLQDKYDKGVLKGATGGQGVQGIKGDTGADAYTVVLSLESWVIPSSTSAAIAGSVAVNVIAFKGSEQIPATIGTITGQVSGLTATISSNDTTSATFTVNATTSLTTRSGVLTIPITVDGNNFVKKFSWALSLTGAQGVQGVPGTSLNMELIFSGDANTQGSSYTVSKSILNFKELHFRTDISSATVSNFLAVYQSISVSDLNNKEHELALYSRPVTSDILACLYAHFTSNTVFKISMVALGTYSRLGVTKIWGVY